MFYFITFYSNEFQNQDNDFLIESDACEGHHRVGDINRDTEVLVCELYHVFDESVFLRTITRLKVDMPSIEAYRRTTLFP